MLKRYRYAAMTLLLLAAGGLSGCYYAPAPGYYAAPGYGYAPYGYYGGYGGGLEFSFRDHDHGHRW